jgi:hypothetical protein
VEAAAAEARPVTLGGRQWCGPSADSPLGESAAEAKFCTK